MRETEATTASNDTTVDAACPVCSGPVMTRPGHGTAWIYCRTCRRLSLSVMLPGPTGGALLIHQLAAA